MITRIVKLSISPEFSSEFIDIFNKYQNDIATQKGCHSTELKQDTKNSNVFFTISIWDSEDDLNNYRNSSLFGIIWPTVKKWFNNKPEAWSITQPKTD